MSEQKPYRGKPVDKSVEWVYGGYCENEGLHYIIPDTSSTFNARIDPEDLTSEHFVLEGLIEVIPETVGQQVGKQDINEQEIHDGDTIEVVAERSHVFDNFPEVDIKPFKAKVFWESYAACWFYEELEYGEGGHPLANCKCKITGSIHEEQ